MPDSLTHIGYQAFYNCSSLTELQLPDGVETIEYGAFGNCKALTNLELPDSVTLIGNSMFQSCTGLETVKLPAGLTDIPVDMFYDCSSLSEITIPETVTSIDSNAFYGCSSLHEITIPRTVTTMGEHVLGYSVKEGETMDLTILCAPNSTAHIYAQNHEINFKLVTDRDYSKCPVGYYIQDDGAHITDCDPEAINLEIPATVEDVPVVAIEKYAFRDSALESVVIPDTVTTIGDEAFYGCGKLKEIQLPASVTSLGNRVFAQCTSLTSADLSLLTITWIPSYAFNGCNALKAVSFPQTLEYVSMSAFQHCTALEELTFPDNSIAFDDNCFYNCSSLSNVTFPTKYCDFDYYSFGNCTKLLDITVSGDSTLDYNSIGFYDDGASGTVKQVPGVTFHVPFNSNVQHYVAPKEAFILKPTDGVKYTVLEDQTVRIDQISVKSTGITIPARIEGMPVSAIGTRALKGLSGVTNITLPNTLTSIEDYAFMNCTSLSGCYIPAAVTWIGSNAFYNTQLSSKWKSTEFVILGDGVLYQYNGKAQEITVPDTVKVIGEGVFAYQTNLQKVTLHEGLTRIGDGAFLYCQSLASVELPDTVTCVGNAAFSGCTGLKRFTCGTDLALIDEYAFFDCTIELFRGEDGSYAQSYAKDNGYTFEILPKEEPVTPETDA